jgi:hypothetical protein
MERKLAFVLGLASIGAAAYLWRSATANSSIRDPSTARDRAVDEASEESFPASDAPAHTPTLGSLATSQ